VKLPIASNDNQIDPLLRLATVTELTCLGKSTIYRMMDAGQFPLFSQKKTAPWLPARGRRASTGACSVTKDREAADVKVVGYE
jgi:hypothetical protein